MTGLLAAGSVPWVGVLVQSLLLGARREKSGQGEARRFKPRLIVDLATLTGAIVVALGKEYAGLFSNDDRLAGELHARLRYATIDRVFKIGLREYLGGVRDDIATLSNEIGRQFLLD